MRKGIEHLAASDPLLAEVMRKLKLKRLPRQKNYFGALIRSILYQQISTKAGDAIAHRFHQLFPGKDFPEPRDVIRIHFGKLRKAGLSRAKATYIKDLARRVIKGEVDFAKIHLKKDEEVIAELVKIKGVGRWTAEMFLIFTLRRPDVFSAKAIQNEEAPNLNAGRPPRKKVGTASLSCMPLLMGQPGQQSLTSL
jgi:DNA-3-methyladenine glycosylase II